MIHLIELVVFALKGFLVGFLVVVGIYIAVRLAVTAGLRSYDDWRRLNFWRQSNERHEAQTGQGQRDEGEEDGGRRF